MKLCKVVWYPKTKKMIRGIGPFFQNLANHGGLMHPNTQPTITSLNVYANIKVIITMESPTSVKMSGSIFEKNYRNAAIHHTHTVHTYTHTHLRTHLHTYTYTYTHTHTHTHTLTPI